MVRRVKRRCQKPQQYSRAQVHSLLTGYYINRRSRDSDWHPDAWAELSPYLLGEYIERFPGYRPYAWWECEAPERRQVLAGPPVVWPGHVPRSYWFGTPTCHPPLAWEPPYQEFESTAAYLSRLGLLTEDEQSAELDYETVFHPVERRFDVSPIVDLFPTQFA